MKWKTKKSRRSGAEERGTRSLSTPPAFASLAARAERQSGIMQGATFIRLRLRSDEIAIKLALRHPVLAQLWPLSLDIALRLAALRLSYGNIRVKDDGVFREQKCLRKR